MKITKTVDYAAPTDVVYAMLTDPAFQERKCVEAGALRHDVTITAQGEGSRILTRRDLPTQGLPDFAKSLVGSTLAITETYRWGGAGADGSRDGDLTVEVAGAPIAMRATVRLAPSGTGSSLTVDGELKASIPLLGGKIEKAAAPAVTDAMDSEYRTAQEWLVGRR
ncbi:MAG TPA: DUF2505 domain-containing protein [Intrasporangium sp.]|uniref:DUF2505 domain-containing protein n=1 Tax=Intrasporangium sp. TaxID=1925024 RepID=UPI002D783CAF|nr:DUF2505 domain-containing protein [Intrasporangium sp.]HET7399987.1 DUF2505 domain-containing protein [Intrasporangium sp.]